MKRLKLLQITLFLSILLFCKNFVNAKTPCPLEGVKKNALHNTMATIYSVRYSRNGLAAQNVFNVVRHNPCPGGGVCKWIFRHCQGNEFVLESKKYRGKYLYANVANAVSYFRPKNNGKTEACKTMNYTWKMWYDKCSGNYYIQNNNGLWLDASDTGLVKHTVCKSNPKHAWNSCGKWRRWKLESLTTKF